MREFLSRALRFSARRLGRASERLVLSAAERDARRYRDCYETVSRVTEFLKPRTLCDIGANIGHWTYVMDRLNPDLSHVTMFEPQSACRERLASLELPGVEKVIYPFALGTRSGTATIKGGTASASLLDVGANQDIYFPGTFDHDTEETVRVEVLDDVYGEGNLPYPDLIKLDVQGFELDVLRGAETVLRRARGLVVELSFRGFYAGQPPLWELLRFLEERRYVMVAHGFEWQSQTAPRELLQLDGIFLNTAAD